MKFKLWLEVDEGKEEPVFNHGPHTGKKLSEVPDEYLQHMLSGQHRFLRSHAVSPTHVQDELERRRNPPAQIQQTTPVIDPVPQLRKVGLDILKGKAYATLTAEQVATLKQAAGTTAFARTQFYSEACPPTKSLPGWIAFNFYDAAGVISIWQWGRNFGGMGDLQGFLRQVIDNKYENKYQELEDELFDYSGDDNTEFDKKMSEIDNINERWRGDFHKLLDFMTQAREYWYSKINDRN